MLGLRKRQIYTTKYSPDQPRAENGRFGAGSGGGSKVDAARARTAEAAQKLDRAAAKSQAAQEKHATSRQAAEHAVSQAKAARAAAKRDPSSQNLDQWHKATKAAISARQIADRHQQEATAHAARHEKAELSHALAEAKQREAERAAVARPASGPRSIPVVETPSYTVGTGRVAGAEPEAPKPEAPAARQPPKAPTNEEYSRMVAEDRERRRDASATAQRAAAHRQRFPLDHVPGVSAISMPAWKRKRRRQFYTVKPPSY